MSLIPAGTVVTVETKWFPPLNVELSGAAGEPGLVLRILKPKVTVSIKGQKITSAAPAGEPFPNQWPKVKIGLAVATALLAFSVMRFFR